LAVATPHDQDELTSWKEIAAYLQVSVRTAQGWERERGLPVKRLPGSRSRVAINLADLERWRSSVPAAIPEPPSPRRPSLLLLAILAVLLPAASAAVWLAVRPPPQPASFRLDGSALVVFDSGGRELWRKAFGGPLIQKMDYGVQMTWLGDLDGDRRNEVLFIPLVAGSAESPLICYTDRGAEKWRFQPGREVATRGHSISRSFAAAAFAVFPLGGRNVVALASNHYLHFPAQVALLTADGGLLGEYWHSGHLVTLAAADLDGDGVHEIYAGGINNAQRAATLVALDPRDLVGASAEDPEFQLLGFPPATEQVRLFFPRTCISRLLERYSAVAHLIVEPGRITAAVRETNRPPMPSVYFHLTAGLELHSITPGDQFRAFHKELEARGELDHPLTPAEENALWQVRRVVVPPHP
jgi:hypothetical protein